MDGATENGWNMAETVISACSYDVFLLLVSYTQKGLCIAPLKRATEPTGQYYAKPLFLRAFSVVPCANHLLIHPVDN